MGPCPPEFLPVPCRYRNGSPLLQRTVACVVLLAVVGTCWSYADELAPPRAENHSYETLCAEVDNVNVPFYHPKVASFRITATHPTYMPSSINARGADFTACSFADRRIWIIGEPDKGANEFRRDGYEGLHGYYAQDNPAAGIDQERHHFPKEINNDWLTDQYIYFTADEDEDANIELKIGSRLIVSLAQLGGTQMHSRLEVQCRTWNGSGWTDQGNRVFTPESLSHQWHIPDQTWLEGEDANTIHLGVVTEEEGGQSTTGSWGIYDYVELRKRELGGETTMIPLMSNDVVAVIPVHIDFWWRYPESMSVKLKNGATATNVHYLRILKRTPLSDPPDMDEVFVLYQDGNARMIPLPPDGVDWVPYGGSIILGPSKDGKRPFSAIEQVVVDEHDLSMVIQYQDGSKAHVNLWVDQTQLVADVTGLTYPTEEDAFTRFRSMWVCDGKSDIDRVKGEEGIFPMMHHWEKLHGSWWEFAREVPSYHNTYSPDFKIEILQPSTAYLVREAETLDSGQGIVQSERSAARGERTITFSKEGGTATYAIELSEAQPETVMRIRYADDDGGDGRFVLGNAIEVLVDGEHRAATYSSTTGGWDEFEIAPSLRLGDLAAGAHEITIRVGAGTFGLDIDAFELVSQAPKPAREHTVHTIQGEAMKTGNGYELEDRVDAVGGITAHFDKSGGYATYVLDTDVDLNEAYMRIRYSDDVAPTRVEVYVDDQLVAKLPTEGTGDWDTFTTSPNLYIGSLSAGKHHIKLQCAAETWGVDIDEFEVFGVEHSP